MGQDYPFKIDTGVDKYRFIITVHENAITSKIELINGYEPTIHELLGIIESSKFRFIIDHAERVKESKEKGAMKTEP